jgi:FKBP-type peptidyl-prolyl cis-trans isomerase 2
MVFGTRRTVMSRELRVIRTISLPASIGTTLVLALASLCLAVAGADAEESETKEASTVIQAGSTVGIEYTLTLEDGTKVDSNVGGEVLRVQQGSGQIIPGLDKELIGMAVGESKQVTVGPDQAYGQVDPSAFAEVSVSELPEDGRQPGTVLMTRDAQGNTRRLRVHKVEGEQATLDFNHPLAGKTLTFDVTVREIE